MPVVIELVADGLQAGVQLGGGQQVRGVAVSAVIMSIVIPSQATSQPASRTARYAALSSSRIGLVLLMWMKTLRGTAQRGEALQTATGAGDGQVPHSSGRARFRPYADELVVRPERAVQQQQVALFHARQQRVVDCRHARQK